MSRQSIGKVRKSKWLMAAALSSLGASLSAGHPDIDGVQKPLPRTSTPPPALTGQPSADKQARPSGASTRIHVSSIALQGLDLLTEEEKRGLFGRLEGRQVSLDELDALCATITHLTRSKGHFLARAYLPQQEVKDGVVAIAVLEAKVESTKVVNASLVDDATINMRLSVIPPGTPATEQSIGMALAAVSDLPGAQIIKAAVSPGAQTGGTILSITATPAPKIRGLAYFDNHGAIFTGRNRVGASLIYASPSGTGDEIGLSIIQSLDAGLTSGMLRYEKPTSPRANTYLLASHSDYSLGEDFALLNAHGNADAVETGIIVDLKKSLESKLRTSFAVGYRKLNDRIDATATQNPKKDAYCSASLEFEPAAGALDKKRGMSASIRLTAGKIDFLDAASRSLDASSSNTQGHYEIAEAELGYSYSLSAASSFALSVRTQNTFGSKNLDGSRRFGVTGPDGLRGYSPSELLGDNGSLIRAEYRCVMATGPRLDATVTVFLEQGRVSGGNEASEVAARSLHDYGINLKLGVSSWFMDASIAVAENAITLSEPSKDVRLLLKLGKQF